MARTRNLDRKIRAFVERYVAYGNGARAAMAAGYGAAGARVRAYELLQRPDVRLLLAEEQQAASARTQISQNEVLLRFWGIATADVNDLIELRRVCCRYCHGKGHRFQRTRWELEEARRAWRTARTPTTGDLFAESPEKIDAMFDELGGDGFNGSLDPAMNCPECFGDGEVQVFAKDTRDLSPNAKLLYAGVRQTKHGFEIQMHDQLAALTSVGRALGLFGNGVQIGLSRQDEKIAFETTIEINVPRSKGRLTPFGGQ
jgi:phage terminase small subunit